MRKLLSAALPRCLQAPVPLNHPFNTAVSRPLLISVGTVPPLAKCSGVSLPEKL